LSFFFFICFVFGFFNHFFQKIFFVWAPPPPPPPFFFFWLLRLGQACLFFRGPYNVTRYIIAQGVPRPRQVVKLPYCDRDVVKLLWGSE
jgi:hypothetical protein